MSLHSSKFILSIDLGTSGPKVALFSTRGERVGAEFESTPVHLLPNGGAEQNAEDWWQAVCAATRRLVARGLVRVEDLIGIACTTQWSGTVAVDRDGNALHSAIIWMDARGAPYVRRVTSGPLSIQGYGVDKLLRWVRLTGGIPGHSGKDSIAHILYLKNARPEVYRGTFKFLEPMDYLGMRLTGQMLASYNTITLTWVTDNRNLRKVEYAPALLRLLGIERDKLPDLRPPATVLGSLTPQAAQALGLPDSVRVVMGTPDIHSSAIGAGTVRDFDAHLYVGTSAWLTCHVPYIKTDLLHNMASLPSAIPGRYLLTNEQQSAGACLTYIRDNLLYRTDELGDTPPPPDAYQRFDRAAEHAPAGSHRVIFTPWLYGERTPIEDKYVRGVYFNQSLEMTREVLVRAVFEGVAYNARWLLEAVESFVGRRLSSLAIIGGGAQSRIWCQIMSDVLDREIRQIKDPIHANARGAALLAAVALGTMAWDDIATSVETAETFTPTPANRGIYDELFREFKRLYSNNAKTYARLNRSVK